MFFFIAGIQPKTVDLDESPRMCPACGLYQARLRRADHYLSVFFLPIFRVKRGEPFIQCSRCGTVSKESGEAGILPGGGFVPQCSNCGRSVEGDFRFCPYCGNSL